MDSDIFSIRDAHVDEELLDLLTMVSLHDDFLFMIIVFIGLVSVLILLALLLAFLALLRDSAVGLEVLHRYQHTFFQNLSIFFRSKISGNPITLVSYLRPRLLTLWMWIRSCEVNSPSSSSMSISTNI